MEVTWWYLFLTATQYAPPHSAASTHLHSTPLSFASLVVVNTINHSRHIKHNCLSPGCLNHSDCAFLHLIRYLWSCDSETVCLKRHIFGDVQWKMGCCWERPLLWLKQFRITNCIHFSNHCMSTIVELWEDNWSTLLPCCLFIIY